MRCPTHLSDVAKAYWKRNAPHAGSIGTLTPATYDSFAELSRLYAEMQLIDTVNDPKGSGKYANLLKLFSQLTRYFGLCPDGKAKQTERGHEEPDEFDL